jgi:predicted transport protein|tara:strand:- start:273 stop:404 length:132 start_codon:yes stop_codon:yes gene_type:complete
VGGFARDVTDVGHWGTRDLELTLKNTEELQRAMPLFLRAYERT